MSDPRPRARAIDPLPRTVLAWQRTLVSTAATALLITVALVRGGAGPWAVGVLLIAVLPIPAALRREQGLLPHNPRPVAAWKVRLVTAVALLLAAAGGLVVVIV